MKQIPLTKGKFALVDDEDYEFLMRWKWHLGGGGYAVRNENIGNKKRKTVLMHRVIARSPDGMDTDHINGDKLDNRRVNIRACSRSQNKMNCGPQSNSKSGCKGVFWCRVNNRWLSQIKLNGKGIHLGYFSLKEQAAEAYNAAALKYHGEFAKLNEVPA